MPLCPIFSCLLIIFDHFCGPNKFFPAKLVLSLGCFHFPRGKATFPPHQSLLMWNVCSHGDQNNNLYVSQAFTIKSCWSDCNEQLLPIDKKAKLPCVLSKKQCRWHSLSLLKRFLVRFSLQLWIHSFIDTVVITTITVIF